MEKCTQGVPLSHSIVSYKFQKQTATQGKAKNANEDLSRHTAKNNIIQKADIKSYDEDTSDEQNMRRKITSRKGRMERRKYRQKQLHS
jgi:hypothetical protein